MMSGLLMFAPVGPVGECLKIAPPRTIAEDALCESLQVIRRGSGSGRVGGMESLAETLTEHHAHNSYRHSIFRKGKVNHDDR
jgi:hypothetical protein